VGVVLEGCDCMGIEEGDKDGYLVVELVFGFEDGWQLW
jgi:hypothetical protein